MSNEKEKDYEGFVDVGMDFDKVVELAPVPTGAYNLTITSAKATRKEQPDGTNPLFSIKCLVDVDGNPAASTIFHDMYLPIPGDDAKKANFKAAQIKKFYRLFEVPLGQSGINTTDLIGAQAKSVQVELTSYQPSAGGEPKPINRIVLPK